MVALVSLQTCNTLMHCNKYSLMLLLLSLVIRMTFIVFCVALCFQILRHLKLPLMSRRKW